MSKKIIAGDSLPVEVTTLRLAREIHGGNLEKKLVVVLSGNPPGVYHIDLLSDAGVIATHLVTGEQVTLAPAAKLVTGIELPVDGDNSNLANVHTNQNLANTLNQSAEWHGEAEGTVSKMIDAVMDETATTVNLTDSISVDLQVNGVREQIGSVLGIVSSLFSRSPLREMP